ncbi:uncharacterized protein LOC121869379 isoform X2 [Homarus americanus]|uniref:Potassium channel subfamily K member 9-like 1 n=2 Tax=Homarus americanus TaxID=6706 RepID=A0A8J5MXF5_HOMAM|nr:uncharacterized protein LOC121869379 isoform X2 [Homarus americanus]XP_042226666.1 uncharacterized protein LOC121869379 isoform X2 [Homarus americanus]KAG7166549.1 Potassium channel subfamily K member 9-like 1 [Homarus americanus]
MGKCSWSGFERGVKLVITFVFSHVGLCAFVAGYSVAGAFLFKELEQKHIEVHYEPLRHRSACFHDLYNITERAGEELSSRDWREIFNSTRWQEEVMERLTDFEDRLVTAVSNQLYDQDPDKQRERWSIIGSLFYCVTVITTIGYGHVSPKTWEGKMVTIVYAIMGIPLMLLCLTNIGNSMAVSFRFMYRRVCCVCCRNTEEEDDQQPSSTTLQTPSGSTEPAAPPPYTPPPSYKPSRRNMLISPPISATIHRGSDNPFALLTGAEPSNSSSKTSTPRHPRPSQTHLILPDAEANRIVAECAAYTKTTVPGLVITSLEPSHNECHDYDTVPMNNHLSPSSTTHQTPEPSAPSSPLSRDAPTEWTVAKENGGPHIVIEVQTDHPPSNNSTRPGSPALTSSTHHASSTSLAASSSLSRPWPRQESSSSTGGLMPYGSEGDDSQFVHVRERPPTSPGKTLVVYNTLSGDALLEQSRVARRMALMNKGGFGQIRAEATTVFTDPITGQAVNGDMLGLSYRPIPPDTSGADNRVPIPIVMAFVASYIGVGALLFGWLEGWSLLDAGYFCFITLSTIGFGDFVPGKSLGYETQEAQIKLVTGSLYLMFGLAVLAMSFNLVQEEVVLKCKAFALWIGLMKE